ncbi:MAG: DUF5667 domain-containing protein [Mycobacteriales bacterium]
MAALTALVSRIPAAPATMDAAAMETVRRRMLAVAAVRPEEPAGAMGLPRPGMGMARLSWRAQRRFTALVAAAAAVIAVAGIGASASRSLPSEPLYGLKQAAETLQLDLTGSALAKAALQEDFAGTRIAELTTLIKGSDLAAEEFELRAIAKETRAAQGYLLEGYRGHGGLEALRDFARSVHAQEQALMRLAAAMPRGLRGDTLALIVQLGGIARQAQRLGSLQVSGGANRGPNNRPSQPAVTPAASPASGRLGTSATPSPSAGHPSVGEPQTSNPTSSPLPSPLPSLLPSPLPSLLPSPLPSLLPSPLPSLLRSLGGSGFSVMK